MNNYSCVMWALNLASKVDFDISKQSSYKLSEPNINHEGIDQY